jgi:integral membrane sensor domain MASE1
VLFVVCAAVVAPFLSSFLDAAFVRLNGWGTATTGSMWRTRFFSNVLATLTLVPVVVIVATERSNARVPPARWIEADSGWRCSLHLLAAFVVAARGIGDVAGR